MRIVEMILAFFAMVLGLSPQPAHAAPAVDLASADGTSEELSNRKAMMEEIHQHILARDFAWLDATERTLRTTRARQPSGVWKLELFYNSMWYLGTLADAPDCSDTADEVLASWRKASPRSPAAVIASAARSLGKAWCFRGDGYAQSVDAAAWEPFEKNVAAAYDMLTEHEAIASVDPHYYKVLASIYVAQGRSEKEFRALLKTAIAKEPYYYPMYDEAFRYFQPQWFGSYEEEEAIAQLAAEQTHARDRSSAYARVYWNQMECGCLGQIPDLNLPRLRQGMQDLAELYPEPWNLSHMARMACEIGDGDLARRYFQKLPAGDDGRSGWVGFDEVDVPQWQACRIQAKLEP